MASKLKIFVFGIFVLFYSCDKKDEEIVAPLKIAREHLTIFTGDSEEIEILSGSGVYDIRSSNNDVLKVNIKGNIIYLKALNVQGPAEAIIYVVDSESQISKVYVTISSKEKIRFEQENIVIPQIQVEKTLMIENLSDEYDLEVSDPSVVKASVENDKITLRGRKRGKSSILIQDKIFGTASLSVEVIGENRALDFGDKVFGYATFADIAVEDKSITQLEQVTFEMTCKIQGYRGLQTFMGLEGQLLIRGKNDDYKATHPIEITGLGDKIILETKSSFNLDQWMNIALVVDGTKRTVKEKYKFYINGVEDELIVQKKEATHDWIDLTTSNDGDRFVIGRSNGQDWRVIRGFVSEARVWKVARTAEQIAVNKCSLVENDPKGLFAHWDFTSGVSTDYIEDINGGRYESKLFLSDARKNNFYAPVSVSEELFILDNCEL